MEPFTLFGIFFFCAFISAITWSLYFFFKCSQVMSPYDTYLHFVEGDEYGLGLLLQAFITFMLGGLFFVISMKCFHPRENVQLFIQVYIVTCTVLYIVTYLVAGTYFAKETFEEEM